MEKAENVNAPVFTNFPITFECRVAPKYNEQEPGGDCNVVADIINVRCEEDYLDSDGKPDLGKIKIICFDSISNTYRILGQAIGNAFKDGSQLKKV